MADEKESEKTGDWKAEVVKGVAKPLYDDAVHPLAVQTGKALETAGRAVNVALMPLRTMVYAFEQLEPIIQEGLSSRLQGKKEEEIETPAPNVAVPAIEALRYTAGIPELREAYLNLLATSMDKDTSKLAHPSFVETLKQLSPDEAKVLCSFLEQTSFLVWQLALYLPMPEGSYEPNLSVVGIATNVTAKYAVSHADLLPSYLDNLKRLGLIDKSDLEWTNIASIHHFEERATQLGGLQEATEFLSLHQDLTSTLNTLFAAERRLRLYPFRFGLTNLGRAFVRSCVA